MNIAVYLAYQTLFTILIILKSIIISIFRLIVPYRYRAKSVKGQFALVTGAGSGIGKLMAKKLAQLGARLILIDVNEEANEKTANEILIQGGSAKSFTCDLSKREEIYRVANEIKKTVGDIQILVNNAGIVTGKKFLDSSDIAIERTFQVNTLAHFWLCKAFLPGMMDKNQGHIVTVASMAGLFGSAGLCDYCASKFAAVGFDESLKNELIRLNKTGVRTTLVCPFYISTGMFEGTQTHLIPFLEPEYVADKIIEALLTNQEILMLPKLMYFMFCLKDLFQWKLHTI